MACSTALGKNRVPDYRPGSSNNYTLFLQEQFYKNNEAQICSKIKKKLRTFEARLQMEMSLQVFIKKHITPFQCRSFCS